MGAVDRRGLVDDTMMMAFMTEREAAGPSAMKSSSEFVSLLAN